MGIFRGTWGMGGWVGGGSKEAGGGKGCRTPGVMMSGMLQRTLGMSSKPGEMIEGAGHDGRDAGEDAEDE